MALRFGGYQLTATWIFDLEDSFARQLGTRGRHPRPLEPLRFWLVDQQLAPGTPGLPLPIELAVVVNASGYHTFFDDVVLAGGVRRQIGLPAGKYAVRVTSPYYQAATLAGIAVPMPNPLVANPQLAPAPPFHFDLQPGASYPFAGADPLRVADLPSPCAAGAGVEGTGPTLLRGVLFGVDGRPISGATVTATLGGSDFHAETDEHGQWLLAFGPAQATGTAAIVIAPPSGPALNLAGVCVVRGRQVTVPNTSLRGSVWQSRTPVANATVQVVDLPAKVTTDSTGAWSYVFALDQEPPKKAAVTATLPGGASQQTTPQFDVLPGRTTDVPPLRF